MKKEPKDQKSIKKSVVRSLACKLTKEARAKAGEDLEANLSKIEAVEATKKAASEQAKADIELLLEVQVKLRNMIKTGAEEREVKCEEETDYRHGEVRVKRLDTGEVFSKRNMAKDEMQLPLDAQKPGGKLLGMDGAKKDRSELKDVKPEGEAAERKTPEAGDTIEVETRSGWKSGMVLPISGSVLDVDVGEEAPVQVPIESQMWRWPGEGKALATVGEVAATHEGKTKGKKTKTKKSARGDEVDVTPPEDGAF